ncbi:MAG: hypothetical protein ABI613_09710, partial [Gemmatimonadota bacterium]
LFIGNSLTYFNDLPRTLAGLALSAGDTIETASVAKPNFAVIDHANGMSNAVDVIRGSHWDFVVLQQGPTSEQLGRDTLILATRRLDPDIRAAGGRTAEMMTWPNDDDRNDFGEVRQSSQLAAEAVDGIFLPAGEAWRIAWTIDASLPLYGPDGFHPSPAGTYLAALVIYETLTGHPAEALPPRAVVNGQLLNLSSSIVRLLQRAAHEAVVRYPVTQSTNPSSRR